MIKLPLFQQKKEKCFLSLDVGTAAVKALIFSLRGERQDKRIAILGKSLCYFDRFGVFDSKDFEKDVIKKAISETIFQSQKQSGEKPNLALLSLPANVLKGRILFELFKKRDPAVIIDKKREEAIYQEVLTKTQKKISQLLSRKSGILPKDLHFVNLKVLEIKIDGYEVPQLQGYSGRSLVFRVLAIFLLKDYLKIIENIARSFNLKVLGTWHLSQNLPEAILEENKNCIFLDVGGEITQIFLIKDGKLEKIAEFEMGGRVFTQSLSRSLGITEQEARILLERYSKRLLSIEIQERIRELVAKGQRDWFDNLKISLKKMSPKELLPSLIFLFGGGSLLPEVQEILEEGNWSDLLFISQPKVELVLPKDLKNIEDQTKSLNSPQDIPPLLIANQN